MSEIKFGKIKRVPPKVKRNVRKAAGKGSTASKRYSVKRQGMERGKKSARTRRQMRTA